MPLHKSEDYKLSAVLYYLENNTTYADTCRIFKCSERSLKRWINKYEDNNEIKRDSKEISFLQNYKNPCKRINKIIKK